LLLSFQSSSINPFSPISPPIPSAQVRLGLTHFLLPGGHHFINSFGKLPPSILQTCRYRWSCLVLTLSNLIFLPTAYSTALICFGRERDWWITCNYPTVLKERNVEKKKEYNLRYLLAKVCTTRGKALDSLQQRVNKRNKNRVG
jgi:hypothetical protein